MLKLSTSLTVSALLPMILSGCAVTHAQKVDYAKGLSDTAVCAYALNDPNRQNSDIAKAELASRYEGEDWLTYCQRLLPTAKASMDRQRSNFDESKALIDSGLCTMKGGVMTAAGCALPSQPAPATGSMTHCQPLGNSVICRTQ